jgi:peptidoglycan/LPS O-acetylase OafA/YrhL
VSQKRPLTVLLAFLLVVAQIVISLVATVTAALAPADYRTYATTTPAFLLVLYAAVAYYLWAGRPWARTLALVIAILGLIGNLSVILYYDHTATVAANVVGLIIAIGIVVLLLTPASRTYFSRSTTQV